jgi:hypothetical protein
MMLWLMNGWHRTNRNREQAQSYRVYDTFVSASYGLA